MSHIFHVSPQSLGRRAAALLMASSLLTGCGGAQMKALQAKVADLTDEVSELRRGQAAQRVQFDEFRNRLVMLQDKLDSARVHRSRMAAQQTRETPPPLPHVVLPPTAAQQVASGRSALRPASPPAAPSRPVLPSAPASASPAKTVVIGPNGVVRVSANGRTTESKATSTTPRSAGVASGAGSKSKATPGMKPLSPAERAAGDYRAAKAELDAGQLRRARDQFTAFLRDHPDHTLADNALYWMGETWYAQSLWLRAARVFGQVVEKYPRGNKVPDAMLKTALCYLNLGEQKLARDTLTQVLSMYPGTSAARVARAKLNKIRSGS